MMNRIKQWIGVAQPSQIPVSTDQILGTAQEISQVCLAVDAVYGRGFARRNPHIVAQFMQAIALRDLADAQNLHGSRLVVELTALRELLASGSAGITVGIEKS